jgi:hypothetical protein
MARTARSTSSPALAAIASRSAAHMVWLCAAAGAAADAATIATQSFTRTAVSSKPPPSLCWEAHRGKEVQCRG